MPELNRPLPRPTAFSEEFWRAASEQHLVHPWCERCARAFFPPQYCCPGCLEADWGWRESTGRGELYSWTVVHRAPLPGFEVPYVIGVVDLDEEGFVMMSNVVNVDLDQLRIGLPLRVCWASVGDVQLPMFEPDGSA